MNEQLLKKMKQRKGKLKSALDLDKKTLDDFVARKDSLNKKEYKEAYDLQCSYNKLAREYNEVCEDIEVYEKASEEKRAELEAGLIAKYSDKKIEEINDFEKTNEGKINPTLKGALIGSVSALAICIAIGLGFKHSNSNNALSASATAIVDVQDEETLNNLSLIENGLTASDTAIVDVQDEELEPGSYGTFLDVNDLNQRAARLEYIHQLDLQEIEKLKDLGVTKETIYETYTIEDKAAMMESLLAISKPNASDLDYYSEMYSELTVHLQNHPVKGKNYWNPIYSYLYLPDNSKASALVKEFVDAYNKVAEAFRTGDKEATIKYGKEFNSLFIDKIIYQGLHLPNGISNNANYENPLSIASVESEYKYIAMKSIRFLKAPLTEISDYLNDGFCVPGCINGETGYTEEWSLEKTINEFDEGLPNQEILRDTGKVVREECLEVQYYKWLLEHAGSSYTLK